MEKVKLWTAPFLTMGTVNFIQFFTQYVLVTTLPLVIMDSFAGTQVEAGMAMTAFQLGACIFRPIAGHFIDQKNKKYFLLASLLIFTLIITAFNALVSIEEIYALRFVHGIFFSLATTAAAAVAVLVIPPKRRGEGIGYFSVTTNLAMVVGPLCGLLLYQHFSDTVLFLVLTVAAIAILLLSFFVPLPKDAIQPSPHKVQGSFISRFIEVRSLFASLLGGMVFFAYGGILSFISLYAKDLGLAHITGLFFTVFALAIVLSRPVIGPVFDHLGAKFIIYPGFVLFIAGLLLFSQVKAEVPFLIAAAIIGLGFGALSPSFQTLAIQSVPPDRAGAATATYFWFLDIFVGLAAAILGFVALYTSYEFMYGAVSTAVLVIAAVLYTLHLLKTPGK